ncbi:hypothetical protein VHARVF571_580074 [Vibrio harveyi]|nr:hypothetical protein VHARVF571_580074 [Vibrio harveyi]
MGHVRIDFARLLDSMDGGCLKFAQSDLVVAGRFIVSIDVIWLRLTFSRLPPDIPFIKRRFLTC